MCVFSIGLRYNMQNHINEWKKELIPVVSMDVKLQRIQQKQIYIYIFRIYWTHRSTFLVKE